MTSSAGATMGPLLLWKGRRAAPEEEEVEAELAAVAVKEDEVDLPTNGRRERGTPPP